MPNFDNMSALELFKEAAQGDPNTALELASEIYNVPLDLVRSVQSQESGGRQSAVSPKGAMGRMQLMPGTAKAMGVNPEDEIENIFGGVRYLSEQLKAFGGDQQLALAAYNAGPGAVRKAGGVPPYKETQGFVSNVLGALGPSAAEAAPPPTSVADLEAMTEEQLLGLAKQLGVPIGGAETVPNPFARGGEAAPAQAASKTTFVMSPLPIDTKLISSMGDQRDKGARLHKGGDLSAPAGTPTVAPTNMEFVAGGQGGSRLKDDDWWSEWRDTASGRVYRFAHHGDISQYKPGDKVAQGQPWSVVGSVIKDPHLHMQVVGEKTGESVDWMKEAGYEKGSAIEAGPLMSNAKLVELATQLGVFAEPQPPTTSAKESFKNILRGTVNWALGTKDTIENGLTIIIDTPGRLINAIAGREIVKPRFGEPPNPGLPSNKIRKFVEDMLKPGQMEEDWPMWGTRIGGGILPYAVLGWLFGASGGGFLARAPGRASEAVLRGAESTTHAANIAQSLFSRALMHLANTGALFTLVDVPTAYKGGKAQDALTALKHIPATAALFAAAGAVGGKAAYPATGLAFAGGKYLAGERDPKELFNEFVLGMGIHAGFKAVGALRGIKEATEADYTWADLQQSQMDKLQLSRVEYNKFLEYLDRPEFKDAMETLRKQYERDSATLNQKKKEQTPEEIQAAVKQILEEYKGGMDHPIVAENLPPEIAAQIRSGKGLSPGDNNLVASRLYDALRREEPIQDPKRSFREGQSEEYKVVTDDYGTFNVNVFRSPDGALTIYDNSPERIATGLGGIFSLDPKHTAGKTVEQILEDGYKGLGVRSVGKVFKPTTGETVKADAVTRALVGERTTPQGAAWEQFGFMGPDQIGDVTIAPPMTRPEETAQGADLETVKRMREEAERQVQLSGSIEVEPGGAPTRNAGFTMRGPSTTVADFAARNIPLLEDRINALDRASGDTEAFVNSGHYDGTYDIPVQGGLKAAKNTQLYRTDPAYREKIDKVEQSIVEEMVNANRKLDILNYAMETGMPLFLAREEFGQSGKRKGGYGVNVSRAWNMEAKQKYGNWYLGDIAIREGLQNSIDAVVDAMQVKQIKKGRIDITYDNKSFTFDDNGIGMSDADIIDKFLALHGTGKDTKGRFGGFGIAKAVILGPHETATWTLHTRDNYFTHEMATDREEVGTQTHRQGTRLAVETQENIITSKARMFLDTTEYPKGVTVTYNGQTPAFPFKGLRKTINYDGPAGDGTTVIVTYYPEQKGLPSQYQNYMISRLVDSKTGAKLTQGIEYIYTDNFKGAVLLDITTTATPGKGQYPLSDSRNSVRSEVKAKAEEVINKYTVDTVGSARAGIETKVDKTSSADPALKEMRKAVNTIANDKSYKESQELAKQLGVEVTPINEMDIQWDSDLGKAGVDPIAPPTVEQAKMLAGLETVVKMFASKLGLPPVDNFYLIQALKLDSGMLEGQYGRGRFGINYTCIPAEAYTNPVDCFWYFKGLVDHEFTHNWVGPHNDQFAYKLPDVSSRTGELMGDLLTIAEAITGKTATDIRTKIERGERLEKPIGIPREQLDLFAAKQGAIDYGPDPELFRPVVGGGGPSERTLPIPGLERPAGERAGAAVLPEAGRATGQSIRPGDVGVGARGIRAGETAAERTAREALEEEGVAAFAARPAEIVVAEKRLGKAVVDEVLRTVKPEEAPRVQKALPFFHNMEDIRRIADRTGTVKLYHGAPRSFAQALLDRLTGRGVTARWSSAEDMGRYIAELYGIPYTTFRVKTDAGHLINSYTSQKVRRMSTAPAEVASRWATSFPYGEILSDLNTRARLYLEAERVGVSYEDMLETAWEVAKEKGRVSNVTLADQMELPDKLKDMRGGGSLVEVEVDARALGDMTATEARMITKAVDAGKYTPDDAVMAWNFSYKDMKIDPSNIKSARIVADLTPEVKYEADYRYAARQEGGEYGRNPEDYTRPESRTAIEDRIDRTGKAPADEIGEGWVSGVPADGATGQRFMDDFTTRLTETVPNQGAFFRASRYSEEFSAAPEFRKLADVARMLGIDKVVPVEGSSFFGAYFVDPSGERILFLDRNPGPHTYEEIAGHELFHHRARTGDESAIQLMLRIDTNSPAYQRFDASLRKWFADHDAGVPEQYRVMEDFAANYASGIKVYDVDGRLIDFSQGYADAKNAEAALRDYLSVRAPAEPAYSPRQFDFDIEALRAADKKAEARARRRARGGKSYKELAKSLQTKWAPETLTERAMESAQLYVKHIFEAKQHAVRVAHAVQGYQRLANQIGEDRAYEILAMQERGERLPLEWEPYYDAMRKAYDASYKAMTTNLRGEEKPYRKIGFIENYFGRLWEGPADMEPGEVNRIVLELQRKFMTGRKGFLKQRVFSDMDEARVELAKRGIYPVYDNPVAQHQAVLMEQWRFAGADNFLDDLISRGMGIPQQGGKTTIPVPDGWIPISFTGRTVYVPRDAAAVITNHFSPGANTVLYQKWRDISTGWNTWHVAWSAFHAVTTMNHEIAMGYGQAIPDFVGGVWSGDYAQAMKSLRGLSPMHIVNTFKKGVTGRDAFYNPGKYGPKMDALVEMATAGGALPDTPQSLMHTVRDSMEQMVKHIKGGEVSLAFRDLMHIASKPIMGYWVPRIKYGSTLVRIENKMNQLTRDYAKQYGSGEWAPEVQGKFKADMLNIAYNERQFSDNIFGEIDPDNLHWSPGVAKGLKAFIGYPGWNRGTFAWIGGMGRGIAKTARGIVGGEGKLDYQAQRAIAFGAGLVISQSVMNILMGIAMGNPPEDWRDVLVGARTGGTLTNGAPERIGLASYMKDLFPVARYLSDPGSPRKLIHVAESKLLFPFQMAKELEKNSDYFGTEIVRSRGTVPEKALDVVTYVGKKAIIPFGASSIETGQTDVAKYGGFFGVRRIPRELSNTPAQNRIDELQHARMPQARTKQQAETAKLQKELRDLGWSGERGEMERRIREARTNGLLTIDQIRRIRKDTLQDKSEVSFGRLSLEDMLEVYAMGSDEERFMWRRILHRRIKNARPETRRRLREQIRDALSM